MPLDLDLDDENVRSRLTWVVAQLQDLRPFWPRVVTAAIGWWRQMFETEGAFAGTRWAPLSPAYAAWKAVHYPGRGILVAERDLRQAASSPERDVSPDSLTLTIPWAAVKGEPVELRWHQEGTTQGMPPRPLIFGDPLPPPAALEMDRIMDEYLDDLIARSGL